MKNLKGSELLMELNKKLNEKRTNFKQLRFINPKLF